VLHVLEAQNHVMYMDILIIQSKWIQWYHNCSNFRRICKIVKHNYQLYHLCPSVCLSVCLSVCSSVWNNSTPIRHVRHRNHIGHLTYLVPSWFQNTMLTIKVYLSFQLWSSELWLNLVKWVGTIVLGKHTGYILGKKKNWCNIFSQPMANRRPECEP
jgi:hypothetical protein